MSSINSLLPQPAVPAPKESPKPSQKQTPSPSSLEEGERAPAKSFPRLLASGQERKPPQAPQDKLAEHHRPQPAPPSPLQSQGSRSQGPEATEELEVEGSLNPMQQLIASPKPQLALRVWGRQLKAASHDFQDLPVISFLAGQIGQGQGSPDLVAALTGNEFILEALSSDLATLMQRPFKLGELAGMLGLSDELAVGVYTQGLDPSSLISPKDLFKSLGIDPGQALAELSHLKENLPLEGLTHYLPPAEPAGEKQHSPGPALASPLRNTQERPENLYPFNQVGRRAERQTGESPPSCSEEVPLASPKGKGQGHKRLSSSETELPLGSSNQSLQAPGLLWPNTFSSPAPHSTHASPLMVSEATSKGQGLASLSSLAASGQTPYSPQLGVEAAPLPPPFSTARQKGLAETVGHEEFLMATSSSQEPLNLSKPELVELVSRQAQPKPAGGFSGSRNKNPALLESPLMQPTPSPLPALDTGVGSPQMTSLSPLDKQAAEALSMMALGLAPQAKRASLEASTNSLGFRQEAIEEAESLEVSLDLAQTSQAKTESLLWSPLTSQAYAPEETALSPDSVLPSRLPDKGLRLELEEKLDLPPQSLDQLSGQAILRPASMNKNASLKPKLTGPSLSSDMQAGSDIRAMGDEKTGPWLKPLAKDEDKEGPLSREAVAKQRSQPLAEGLPFGGLEASQVTSGSDLLASPASESLPISDEGRKLLINHIEEHTHRLHKQGGGGLANIHIRDQKLGEISLSVQVEGQDVRLKMLSPSDHIRNLLGQDLMQLRDSLAVQSLNLIDVNIDFKNEPQHLYNQQFAFEQSAQQGKHDQGGFATAEATPLVSEEFSRLSRLEELHKQATPSHSLLSRHISLHT